MADKALIEVFGPLDEIERIVTDFTMLSNPRRNRVGTLLLDYDGLTVMVGDTHPACLNVIGRGVDVMPAAGQLYRTLATRVKHPMQLFDGSTDLVTVSRGSIPAR